MVLSSYAQVDSLSSQLAQVTNDAERVVLLNELAWHLRTSNPAQAMAYAQQGLKIAKQINHLPEQAVSYNRIGIIYKNRGEEKHALSCYQKALAIEKRINHPYGIARAQNQIGVIYLDTRQIEKAIPLFESSAKIFYKLEQKTAFIQANNNLARCHRIIGNHKKSTSVSLNLTKG
ncbi:MAG: tetratricopeptide repeat protein [Bacteroidia bacterium]|nr:tetratricopeptide repeat protein [Bacteroidia bacterium]